jgi:4-carboxymuconolactone decarboxylase
MSSSGQHEGDDRSTEEAKEAKRQLFYSRYDAVALDNGFRLQGDYFLHRVEEFDELDQDFTDVWLRWSYGGMYERTVLDEKTRVLIVVGECCVLGAELQIANHIRSALAVGATKEEVVEVILQSHIYAGMPRMVAAMKQCRTVLIGLGLMEASTPIFAEEGPRNADV